MWLLTRAAGTAVYRVERVWQEGTDRRDLLLRLGARPAHRCAHPLRLIEVRHRGKWYR